MFQGADDLLAYLKDEDVETVDIRFCDLPGVMQHFTCLLYTSRCV